MRQSRWNRPAVALAGAGLAVAMVAVPGSPATAAGQVAGPVLKLAAAQHSITLDSFGGQVYLDPGIWVEVLKSPLQFDVRFARDGALRPFIVKRNSPAQPFQGHRAIHCAAIHVKVAQHASHAARHAALAGARRSVNRDG